jgi:hypothetical protein
MKGSEFLRKLDKLAKARGVQMIHDAGKGKGGHGLLSKMCRDLEIKPTDL